MITAIKLKHWRQFDDIDIKFHKRLTVLTGENGAGKSTILSLLSRHLGWVHQFINSPRYNSDGVAASTGDKWNCDGLDEMEVYGIPIGTVEYDNNTTFDIRPSTLQGSTYEIGMPRDNQLQGFFIHSHRPAFRYQPVTNIDVTSPSFVDILKQYTRIVIHSILEQHNQKYPTNHLIKRYLVLFAAFGPGNKNVDGIPEYVKAFHRFQNILALVLPDSLGFKRILIRGPEVYIETNSGEFVFDAVSGGIGAVIDLAWQIMLCEFAFGHEFVVMIDEPESHLHPSLQRSLMANLLDAFPSATFIVATHSPFIINSYRDSSVYVLRKNASNRVVSELIDDEINKSGTSNDVLREALGVPVTMPIWAEQNLERIARDFSSETVTVESLQRLKSELDREGLGNYFLDYLPEVFKNTKNND